MTDPDDETTQHTIPTTRASSASSERASMAGRPDPANAPPPEDAGAAFPRPPTMPGGPLGEPAPPPPPPAAPPLAADPDRPADPGWREPPWIPPRKRDPKPNLAAVIVGVALIAFGLWFFIDRTLGIALPAIQWRSIWPVLLIIVGGVVLIRSLDRSR